MIKICQRCGESYDALGRAKYCIVCREEKREYMRKRYRQKCIDYRKQREAST
ncbi:MAG: hypothetical protein IJP68_13645 [Selenomonadaceae bacterium]|nr:hypothetical protein [Selenomonadaceae bacterium]